MQTTQASLEADFDFGDLAEILDPQEADCTAAALPELDAWAAEQLAKPAGAGKSPAGGTAAIFDIETGSLPWLEIECFCDPLPPPSPFDESSVKFGNTKDPAKRAEKLAEAKAKRQQEADNYGATCEAHKQQFLGKAALSPLTGRVYAIGYALAGQEPKILSSTVIGDCTEAAILRDWWRLVSEWLGNKLFIVGHNSSGFDWPFLIRRSWRHGVKVPAELLQGRYFSPLLKDTMEIWNCGQRQYVKLDTLARYFHVGSKPIGEDACAGATFAEQWDAGGAEREKAIAYLKNDIAMTAGVAKALAVI